MNDVNTWRCVYHRSLHNFIGEWSLLCEGAHREDDDEKWRRDLCDSNTIAVLQIHLRRLCQFTALRMHIIPFLALYYINYVQ